MRKTIAIDFDGVIHDYSGWKYGVDTLNGPVEEAKESLLQLVKRGYDIAIFSSWKDILNYF